MDRIIGLLAFLLLVVAVLPEIAAAAQAVVPALIGLLLLLAMAKLAWPRKRK